MNVFYEFHKIALALQKARMPYALIGGVAMAFHTRPRFTKDIDILVKKSDLAIISGILKGAGYHASAPPWTFKNTKLTLYRFLKVEKQDEMCIDVLVAATARHKAIIDKALIAESDSLGSVRVVSKKDLIWLKEARFSKLDQADIENLKQEQT
jgi:hypothetical protein